MGAGPVGLLTALRLGQLGVSTLVVESHETLLKTTRAMVYMPVVIPVLRELGILPTVERNAFLNHDGVAWRDMEGKLLGQLPLSSSDPGEFGGVLLIGQSRMNALILEELKKYPSVEVKYGLRCVGVEELPTENAVKAMFHERNLRDEDVIFEADYLIAADGANSAVRRMLCIPFEGFTYQDFKMVGTDCIYDFAKENNFTPLNFIVHPDDWAVIAYSGEDEDGKPRGHERPLWRVAYVEAPDLPDSKEAYLERAYQRVPRWLTGSKEFKVARAEPYWLHQRCAAQARKGRIMLAGDALHVSSATLSQCN